MYFSKSGYRFLLMKLYFSLLTLFWVYFYKILLLCLKNKASVYRNSGIRFLRNQNIFWSSCIFICLSVRHINAYAKADTEKMSSDYDSVTRFTLYLTISWCYNHALWYICTKCTQVLMQASVSSIACTTKLSSEFISTTSINF